MTDGAILVTGAAVFIVYLVAPGVFGSSSLELLIGRESRVCTGKMAGIALTSRQRSKRKGRPHRRNIHLLRGSRTALE